MSAPGRPRPSGRLRLPRLLAAAVRLMWDADRTTLLVVSILQVVTGAGVAAQLLIGKQVLDGILAASAAAEGLAAVGPWLGLLVAVTAAIGFAEAGHAGLHRLLTERTIRRFNERILGVAGAMDLAAFQSPDFHDRLRRAEEQGISAPLQIALNLPLLLSGFVAATAIALALLTIQPVLVPILVAGAIPVWRAASRSSSEMYSFSFGHTPADRARHHLGQLLTERRSAAEVRAFSLAPFLIDRWQRLYDERLAEIAVLVRRLLRRSLAAALTSASMLGITVTLLIWMLLTGRVDVAGAATAAIAVQLFGSRTRDIGARAGQVWEHVLFLDDFTSFLSGDVEPQESGRPPGSEATARRKDRPPAAAAPPFQRLSVEGVGFTYPGSDRPALRDISLEIRAGEVVALVGENGAGKTTLAALLCQLYRPSEGRILWDGADTAAADPRTWQERIAPTFQDFVRYPLTVADNIAVGAVNRSGDRESIAAAARQSGLHETIERLPHGYETLVAKEFEGGAELSGGQWQRVALARAFFRDASFIILDEPTASLDARAERDLFDRIRTLSRGRTVLLISHRFSTVRSADRVYVLEAGRLIEHGSHADLMARAGRYAEMFTLQASAYVEPAGPAG